MNKKGLWSVILVVLLSSTILGGAQKKHVHGEAEGTLLLEGQDVILNLTIPAESVVGFEHTPKTQDEKASVTKAKETLSNPNLVQLYESGWFFTDDTLLSPLLVSKSAKLSQESADKHHHHHHHDHDHDHDHGAHEQHSEFEVKLHFKVNKGEDATHLSTTLFKTLPNLQKLSLTIVNGDQQLYRKLTPNSEKVELTD